MAVYKICYLEDRSYAKKKEVYVDNVIDQYEAMEVAMYKYDLDKDSIIINEISLISE